MQRDVTHRYCQMWLVTVFPNKTVHDDLISKAENKQINLKCTVAVDVNSKQDKKISGVFSPNQDVTITIGTLRLMLGIGM